LRAAGIEPVVSHGGFFLMGRLPVHEHLKSSSAAAAAGGEPYDWRYCRHLAIEHGVIGIPASPFFSPGNANDNT
jgi:hypothetical protein